MLPLYKKKPSRKNKKITKKFLTEDVMINNNNRYNNQDNRPTLTDNQAAYISGLRSKKYNLKEKDNPYSKFFDKERYDMWLKGLKD